MRTTILNTSFHEFVAHALSTMFSEYTKRQFHGVFQGNVTNAYEFQLVILDAE
jgi:hypothetical protein